MILLPLLAACAPLEAESGSVLLLPDDLHLTWSDAYADEDGVGAMFWLDAEVLDPDGGPAGFVRADVTSGWRGAWVLPADAVRPAEDGAACVEPCEVWTSADDGRAWEVRPWSGLRASWADDEVRRSYLADQTDAEGNLAFAVFVDFMPDTGASVPIYVSIAVETGSIEVSVQDVVVDSI